MLKLFSFLILTLFASQEANSSSYPIVLEQSFICDTNMEHSSDCTKLDVNDLIVKTQLLVPKTKNDECQATPLAPTCDIDVYANGKANYTVYYAKTGTVEKWQVIIDVDSQGNVSYTTQSISPTTSEFQNAQEIQEADNLFVEIKNTLSFTESSSGKIENRNGLTPSDYNLKGFDGALRLFGNCYSALAYATNDRIDSNYSGCASFINNWISAFLKKADSPAVNFTKLLKNISVNISDLSLSINVNNVFPFTIQFTDNSFLTLAVTLPITNKGVPSVVLEKNASYMSSGLNLNQFLATNSGLNGSLNDELNYGELIAFMGAKGLRNNCSSSLQSTSRDDKYLITTITLPDDGSKKYSIKVIDKAPTVKEVITCPFNPSSISG